VGREEASSSRTVGVTTDQKGTCAVHPGRGPEPKRAQRR
jgi:hypothetical protein